MSAFSWTTGLSNPSGPSRFRWEGRLSGFSNWERSGRNCRDACRGGNPFLARAADSRIEAHPSGHSHRHNLYRNHDEDSPGHILVRKECSAPMD